jgi:hypothetical protein
VREVLAFYEGEVVRLHKQVVSPCFCVFKIPIAVVLEIDYETVFAGRIHDC